MHTTCAQTHVHRLIHRNSGSAFSNSTKNGQWKQIYQRDKMVVGTQLWAYMCSNARSLIRSRWRVRLLPKQSYFFLFTFIFLATATNKWGGGVFRGIRGALAQVLAVFALQWVNLATSLILTQVTHLSGGHFFPLYCSLLGWTIVLQIKPTSICA